MNRVQSEQTSIKLTPKQRRFVDLYVGKYYGNATLSAKHAGYNHRSYDYVRQIGSKLLTNGHVKAEIDRRLGETVASSQRVLSELTKLATTDLSDCIEVDHEGCGRLDMRRMRRSGKLGLVQRVFNTEHGQRVETYDKLAALGLLSKYHGLLVEKTESVVKIDESALRAELVAKLGVRSTN